LRGLIALEAREDELFSKLTEEDIITFPEGIYGFENFQEYVLLSEDEDSSVMWLKPIKEDGPCFLILDPCIVLQPYTPQMPDDMIKKLQAENIIDLRFLVIANTDGDICHTTVNLKSPVVLNYRKRIAYQVITDDDRYALRHPLIVQNS
jgi:flagellar assembly factor FliW